MKGDRVLVYLGIIDILQSYRLKKKFEHTMKSMITDGVGGHHLECIRNSVMHTENVARGGKLRVFKM